MLNKITLVSLTALAVACVPAEKDTGTDDTSAVEPSGEAAAEPAGEARETSCASCRTKSLVARPRKGRLNEPLSSQQRSAQLA